jgi:hypothetical protein
MWRIFLKEANEFVLTDTVKDIVVVFVFAVVTRVLVLLLLRRQLKKHTSQ